MYVEYVVAGDLNVRISKHKVKVSGLEKDVIISEVSGYWLTLNTPLAA